MRALTLLALFLMAAAGPACAAGAGAGAGAGIVSVPAPAPKEEAQAEKKEEPSKPLPVLTEAQRQVVDAALKDLGSEEYEAREAATKKIKAAGPGALVVLEAALKAGGDDAERIARMKQLVEELMALHAGGASPQQVKRALSAKVSFEFVDKPMKDCLTALCEQLALPKGTIAAAAEYENVAISLRVMDMEMKLALTWLARLADADVQVEKKEIRIGK